MSSLTQTLTPQAEELQRKKDVLTDLEQELAEKELLLSTYRGEMNFFERCYSQRVGARYAELDALKAQMMDLAARVFPQNPGFKSEAESYRRQAEEFAGAAQETGADKKEDGEPEKKFAPPEALRKLYREVAKKIHPDLSADPAERERRHNLMALLNKAYDEQDERKIRSVLAEWEEGAPSEDCANLGQLLIRTLRKIAQVRKRLDEVNADVEQVENSGMYKLKKRIDAAQEEGRDLMAEMAAEVDEKIHALKSRVSKLAWDLSLI